MLFEKNISYNEFHVGRDVRDKCKFSGTLFASTGNVVIADLKNVRIFAEKLNQLFDKLGMSEKRISAGQLNAMGLIDEILHYVSMLYRRDKNASAFTGALSYLDKKYGKKKIDEMLLAFSKEFPPVAVYRGELSEEEYLSKTAIDEGTGLERTNREQTFEELMLLHLANENPAFKPFSILFNDSKLSKNPLYADAWLDTILYFKDQPKFGPFNNDFISFLKEPVKFSPESLRGQLEYIKKHWLYLIGELFSKRLLAGLDTISEEEKAAWHPTNGGSPDMQPYSFENLMNEYERFSPDKDWMPKVVLMAKTVLVWLYQLTKKYGRPIERLDQIPDEELDALRDEGFTGLWLIGLWERSNASKRIKQICGNPEAAASAYSLMDYNIAGNLGGWEALDNLRSRLWKRGIRLASDMVPNHTGMDARWVVEKPDLFVQRRDNPFPQYSYNGENLSHDSRVSVYLEDHYYSKNDCAVVFKRVDNYTGDTRYIYHGNDGTGMPWNDTAQIDFLNPEAREAVIQEILHVAQNFPIIRFDAAMVLAKKHIRRLWYPEPGHGGDIATRSETGLSTQQFNDAIPNEFWREVVDRVAREVPDTLLLAEAFWMMEGYFVRTLGMHRVYNSAFMNMLKKEENQKYRDTVKNTIKFDPQVLKRYVNFMNNPDEETAVAQFGKGDKYFGVCTLMITMPGLPMFGHGQIEGFEEKYGMEYTRAYRDEKPDMDLFYRHQHDIFPLMKKRYLFAGVEDFLFYDVWDNGRVNENIFAYSNKCGDERAVVFYNNKYERASGWIKQSCEYAVKTGSGEKDITMYTRSIAEGLGLSGEDDKYLIFREHHSGLWYVRQCRKICEGGLFISLNGFEYQVMMDIQQVSDTADKKWSTLCDTLQGRGCYDLEVEWQEIHYKKLYAALSEFITPEFILESKKLFEEETKEEIKKLSDSAKEKGIAFYKTASDFAETEKTDAEKRFEKFRKTFAAAALIYQAGKKKSDDEDKKKKREKTPELFKELEPLEKEEKMPDISELLKKAAKAGNQENFIYAGIKQGLQAAECIAVTAAALALDEPSNAFTWSLARKFTEYMQSAGIQIQNQRGILERSFALLQCARLATDSAKAKKSAYEVLSLICESPYAYMLSGANYFDGIKWFNKEKADSALYYVAVNMLLSKAGATGASAEGALAFYQLLAKAKDKAEYKCADFIKPFAPKKPVKKAEAKKASGTDKTKKAAKTEKPAATKSSKPKSKKK